MKILRLALIMNKIKNIKGVSKILNTIYYSLPSFINLGSIIFIVYYMFSCCAT